MELGDFAKVAVEGLTVLCQNFVIYAFIAIISRGEVMS